jgi:tetratricopeptide (TPR) repeat protein
MTIAAEDVRAGGSVQITNEVHCHFPSQPPADEPRDLTAQFDTVKNHIEDYEPAAAIAILERIEKESSSRLTEHSWFKLLAFRGHALKMRGDYGAAARCFLRAKQLRPDTEDGAFVEILAHHLLGENGRAFELATAARRQFCEAPRIVTMWLQTAPDQKGFPELESEIPAHQRSDPEIALGLATAALRRGTDTAAASRYAKMAADKVPSWIDAKIVWASCVIEPYVRGGPWHLSETERGTVQDACAVLRECIDRVRPNSRPTHLANLFLSLSVGHYVLKDDQAAADAVAAAYRLVPDDDEARLQHCLVLFRKGKPDDAITLLEPQISSRQPRIQLAYAQMRAERNRSGDRDAALRVLGQFPEQFNEAEPGLRASWVETLIKLHLHIQNTAAAIAELESERSKLDLPKNRRLILLARAELQRGAKTRASDLVTQVITDGEMPDDDLIDSAGLLELLNLFAQSLTTWKRVIRVTSPVKMVCHVMRLSLHEHDIEYALKLGEELRASGVIDDEAVDLEVATLETVSALRAEALISDLLRKIPEGRLARYLRVRRTHLGAHLKRDDLIERDPDKLPRLDEVSEHLCEPVVAAIRYADPLRAVDFAYNLVRAYPDSRHAYQAMVMSIGLGSDGPIAQIPATSTVEVGTAVLLMDLKARTKHWYVIEDAPTIKATLNEVEPSSSVARAVLGMSVGAEVELDEAFGTKRKVRIDEILPKSVFRFRQCLEQLPRRFPSQDLFKVFHVAPDSPPEEGLKEILEFLEDAQRRQTDVLTIYRENPAVTLHLLAKGIGKPLTSAMELVSRSDGHTIRCCTGASEESIEAERDIHGAREIVADPVALSTLYMLDALTNVCIHDKVREWPWRIMVAEATVGALEAYGREIEVPGERISVVRHGAQIFPQIKSEQETEQIRARLRPALERLLSLIRDHCEVVPGSGLAAVPAEFRDIFVRGIGRASAESAQIASQRNALLWTDDYMVSRLSSDTLGTKRVWTQALCRPSIGKSDPELMSRITSGLLTLKYEFTSISADEALFAARDAKWDIRNRSLATLLDYFAKPTLIDAQVYQIAAHLVRAAWFDERCGLRARDVTYRVVDRLAKRPNGRSLVRQLQEDADGIFGLHVIAAEHVRSIAANWLAATSNEGRIIL